MGTKGFLQALSIAVYISLVGLFMSSIEGAMIEPHNFFGPAAFLLLFSSSALICGLLVFYNPYKLFFLENKKKEAIDLVVFTTAWLFLFFIIAIFLAVLLALPR
jgi:hypothetical protein